MAESPLTAEAVIGRGARFQGLLQLREAARIDGSMSGDVVSEGCVVVGESARVEAHVVADEVIVAGELHGSVEAASRIALLPTARVRAVLTAPRVALADGAFFEGRLYSGSGDSPREAGSRAISSRATS